MHFSSLRIRTPLIALVVALLASSCGADTAELDALRDETSETIAALEGDLEARNETIAGLETDLAAAEESAAAGTDTIGERDAEIEELAGEVTTLEGEVDEAVERADTAEARVQELLVTYDSEIRADAQVAWDEAVATSCAEAGDGTEAIISYVDHTDELATIGTQAELVDAVTACAEPLRNRSAAEKLDAECEPGNVDAVIRDTDSLVGDCLVMFVVPFQWDSRTGECSFLGRWDPSNLGVRSFRYDGDGVFRAGPTVCADELDEADQDDLLKVWVEVTGTFRYDTAAGGTNEIPDFTIRRAELVSKG